MMLRSPAILAKAAIFSRHVSQATIACITAMTQGDFSSATMKHWQIALVTGLLAGGIGVLISFTPLFRRYNPAISFAIITFLSTSMADIINHPSHFGGFSGEAIATGLGAAAISLLISFSPLAAAVERLEKPTFHRSPTRVDALD